MTEPILKLLPLWEDWPVVAARALQEAPAAGRAERVARLLRARAPLARGAGCRLDGAEALLGLEECAIDLAAPLVVNHRERGQLLLALPADLSPADRAALAALLALAADSLSLRLALEELQAAQAEAVDLVTVGEAMVGLAHAVNNNLNLISLQTATVELRVPPELRGEVALIRREGNKAAARLAPLQRLRGRGRRTAGRADLGPLVRGAVADWPNLDGKLSVEVADGLPPVPGSATALRRLVGLLLRVARRLHGDSERPLHLRCGRDEGHVWLALTAAGPALEGEPPRRLGELPLEVVLDPEDELERMAADGLISRTGGRLALAPAPEGGLLIRVNWPV
jgi:hypothetical protein